MCWLCQTTCLCHNNSKHGRRARRLDPSEGQDPQSHAPTAPGPASPSPHLGVGPDLTPLLPPSCHPLHQGHQSRGGLDHRRRHRHCHRRQASSTGYRSCLGTCSCGVRWGPPASLPPSLGLDPALTGSEPMSLLSPAAHHAHAIRVQTPPRHILGWWR